MVLGQGYVVLGALTGLDSLLLHTYLDFELISLQTIESI